MLKSGVLNNNKIKTFIPHDPEVKTFPFSDLPAPMFRKIYKSLNEKGILGKLEPRNQYPDEPQFFIYACGHSSGKKMKNYYGAGGSENEETAIIQSIAEAVEHYCILHERKNLFIRGTYNELKLRAVDPLRFVPFTKKQLLQKEYQKYIVTHDTPLNWIKGFSLTNKTEFLIPASLCYANYDFEEHAEPNIRNPISTGAACGTTTDFATYRGLCEIIERDAYMISSLPEMPKKLIALDKTDTKLIEFVHRVERYNFEVLLFDTTLDCPASSVMCVLIDRSGISPAVCAGLGCGLEMLSAIKSAVIEAVRMHTLKRKSFFRSAPVLWPEKHSPDWFLRKKNQLWSAPHMIGRVKSFAKNATKTAVNKQKKHKTDKESVDFLVKKLSKLNCEIFCVDMTIPEVEGEGLHVIKVICPEMVPLWHGEKYPSGVRRLVETPKKYGFIVETDIDTEKLMNLYPF